jgi:hypothetical protein
MTIRVRLSKSRGLMLGEAVPRGDSALANRELVNLRDLLNLRLTYSKSSKIL